MLVEGVSVAERSLASLVPGTDAIVVVARSTAAPLARFAASRSYVVVRPAVSDANHAGMGLSLAYCASCVIERFPAATTVVIALADMPWVRPATVAMLVTRSQAVDASVQPAYNGDKGHPVVFPARYLSELAACSADVGAKNILRAHASNVHVLDVDDAGVLNSIFDVENARKYIHRAPKNYPLPLDLALPVFSWTLVYRGDELWKIIPGDHAEIPMGVLEKGTFLAGHYLRPGDLLRRETISADLLKNAAQLAASTDLADDATLAFFHLDAATLRDYPVQLIDSVCNIADSIRAKK